MLFAMFAPFLVLAYFVKAIVTNQEARRKDKTGTDREDNRNIPAVNVSFYFAVGKAAEITLLERVYVLRGAERGHERFGAGELIFHNYDLFSI